ncbi:ATP synthase subunit I [Herbaspirillum sp. BH-1]|jgi:ATP synthase protein I|uniref:ATP synthase protein I n=1 Tax=Herbaspirillum frisingense TaxID=92645 RepID=A0ABU1PEP4_9BURK|nr:MULTISPECIES: ATP synthase subunit I [Herbaspirillum]MCI1012452.1 ATP synthase subunit I [Herbaspirillum sp. C7C2]MDR6584394.1 ATP synthase protein I [Herbaspirillum frisingense]ONN66984.1 F0F1 ATP synthase assembly protein I [Herbaspirillum sp. VT-16-41]PLY59639.1 ATP synthase subunit I [Herbaspirillum sp. BH-1]QNB09395.1 ATP synthase subunit I [Herbaspirillum frisingense]
MLRIILLQLVATVVAALVAGMLGGLSALWSALLGGICCVVPNALFALRLHVSAQKPGGTNPMAFFFGEFIKIATTFALMGATVWLYHGVNWLAFLLSFIVVLKSYFILLFRHRP